MRRRVRRSAAVVAVLASFSACGAAAPPAVAFNPIKPVCSVGGLVSGAIAKACSVVQSSGGGGLASKASTALALAAVGAWVLGGARAALTETSHVVGRTTAPQLESTWFSSTYWRVAEISVLLTLPFVFAAATQALIRSDVTLLVRAALGYLPLAMLLVGIAAPLTMLLLAASDQMSAIVSSAAGTGSGHFLDRAAGAIGGVRLLSGSPFLVFFAAVLIVGSAMLLWLELTVRAAAVYVIVLMLPLAFAAMVWPARRIWALRTVEVLVALILSKFAIVAVLSLGGAAFTASFARSITGMVAGVALLGLSVCAPWALLRLLPMSELAAGAVASLRGEGRTAVDRANRALGKAAYADELAAGARDPQDWAATTTAEMKKASEVPPWPSADAGPYDQAAPPGPTASTPTLADDDAAGAAPAPNPPDPVPPSHGPAPVPPQEGPGPVPSQAADAGTHASHERIPGLGDMWQAENGAWESFPLGPWENGMPPSLWSPAGVGPAADPDEGPGELTDPAPPPQPPAERGT